MSLSMCCIMVAPFLISFTWNSALGVSFYDWQTCCSTTVHFFIVLALLFFHMPWGNQASKHSTNSNCHGALCSCCGALWKVLIQKFPQIAVPLEERSSTPWKCCKISSFHLSMNTLISKKIHSGITVFQKTIRAYWPKRRVETNGSFQNHPNSLEIVTTWCYRKPFYIVFPPCKVSNPT